MFTEIHVLCCILCSSSTLPFLFSKFYVILDFLYPHLYLPDESTMLQMRSIWAIHRSALSDCVNRSSTVYQLLTSLKSHITSIPLNISRHVFAIITILCQRQNGCNFEVGIFKPIFLNENCCISIRFLLMFILEGLFQNEQAFIQMMTWYRRSE